MSLYPTYNFARMQVQEVIREAFERCGLINDLVDPTKSASAKRSLNLLLLEWLNRGLNLFTIQKAMLNANTGQGIYTLPYGIIDILDFTSAQTTRQLDGVPFSSAGGIAQNAFDGNPATACTQTSPNGYISYNYVSTPYAILYVGIQSNVNTTYTLTFEYSQDNSTWYVAQTNGPQNFEEGVPVWFVLPQPPNALVWRILETGGETLNVQEIYFNINNLSLLMSEISREDYYSYSNKTIQSSLPSYYFERNNNPTLYLYPLPNGNYPYFIFTYTRQIADVVDYTDILAIPQRFLDAAIAGLAARIARKFFPDLYEDLKNDYEEAYGFAAIEDAQDVPLRIQPNYVSYT